jgi:hypothetical protein
MGPLQLLIFQRADADGKAKCTIWQQGRCQSHWTLRVPPSSPLLPPKLTPLALNTMAYSCMAAKDFPALLPTHRSS